MGLVGKQLCCGRLRWLAFYFVCCLSLLSPVWTETKTAHTGPSQLELEPADGVAYRHSSSEWSHFSATITLFNQVIHHNEKVTPKLSSFTSDYFILYFCCWLSKQLITSLVWNPRVTYCQVYVLPVPSVEPTVLLPLHPGPLLFCFLVFSAEMLLKQCKLLVTINFSFSTRVHSFYSGLCGLLTAED